MVAADPPHIVMVAPNGARLTKADHPAVPLTPAELARTAAECAEAGAAAIHLHVRDADGRHTLDAEPYRDALAAVRQAVGERLVCQITTEAAGRYGPEPMMAVVRDLRPDWVSVAVREIAPTPHDEPAAARFFAWMRDAGIVPQFIVHEPTDALRLAQWRRRGLVPFRPAFLQIVLGRYGTGRPGRPRDLLRFLNAIDPDDHWMVCAFGRADAACALTAATLGGHSRVGFENNVMRADGSVAASNAELVAQSVAGARACGRRIATATAARELIG